MQKLKNLEFYIPLIIGVYLLFAFRFNIYVMPLSYSETEFLSQMIFSNNSQLELFANNVPNVPALVYYLIFSIFGENITTIRITATLFAFLGLFVVLKFGNFFLANKPAFLLPLC